MESFGLYKMMSLVGFLIDPQIFWKLGSTASARIGRYQIRRRRYIIVRYSTTIRVVQRCPLV